MYINLFIYLFIHLWRRGRSGGRGPARSRRIYSMGFVYVWCLITWCKKVVVSSFCIRISSRRCNRHLRASGHFCYTSLIILKILMAMLQILNISKDQWRFSGLGLLAVPTSYKKYRLGILCLRHFSLVCWFGSLCDWSGCGPHACWVFFFVLGG